MNILIGMAGAGSRFKTMNSYLPKYLMIYHGSTMIYHSVNTMKVPGTIHFVVLEEHLKKYDFLESLLYALGHVIIPIKTITNGAAESLLQARDYVKDTSLPMLSINCDQYMKWDSTEFLKTINSDLETSYIPVIESKRDDFSYVKLQNGLVTEVREKKRISSTATMGYYHWARTEDFFIDAESMIRDNVRDNNEFYVAPVYNYTIKRGLPVKTWNLGSNKYFPVGTPMELAIFNMSDNGFD
jgi:dTDP-glucose pyrophosphorylase